MASFGTVASAIGGVVLAFGVTVGPEFIPDTPLTIECENFGLNMGEDVATLVLNCSSESGKVQIQIPNVANVDPEATINLQTGEPVE